MPAGIITPPLLQLPQAGFFREDILRDSFHANALLTYSPREARIRGKGGKEWGVCVCEMTRITKLAMASELTQLAAQSDETFPERPEETTAFQNSPLG